MWILTQVFSRSEFLVLKYFFLETTQFSQKVSIGDWGVTRSSIFPVGLFASGTEPNPNIFFRREPSPGKDVVVACLPFGSLRRFEWQLDIHQLQRNGGGQKVAFGLSTKQHPACFFLPPLALAFFSFHVRSVMRVKTGHHVVKVAKAGFSLGFIRAVLHVPGLRSDRFDRQISASPKMAITMQNKQMLIDKRASQFGPATWRRQGWFWFFVCCFSSFFLFLEGSLPMDFAAGLNIKYQPGSRRHRKSERHLEYCKMWDFLVRA